MSISYAHKESTKRTIATVYNDQNDKRLELLIYPISMYVNRRDDLEDPFVPYTIEMYYDYDICSHQILTQETSYQSYLIEIADKFITEVPFKSMLLTVDSILYEYYLNNVKPNLTSLETTQTSFFDHEQTVERIKYWPGFIERFNKNKMMLLVRNQHLTDYEGIWWNTTKTTKGQ